ncbi:pollen-specific leucine-rich repeat extensin-like protein 1, partial [Momordica charantia]|uniref:Cell wall hydroxyproline-rich glycoprotein n=1 Tax=Momordica charantia TaxID=3673 RepID=A0A6J1DTT4_MOMCH
MASLLRKQPLIACFLLLFLSLLSPSLSLTDTETAYIGRRQLLHLKEHDELPADFKLEIDIPDTFPNERLKKAYVALQAWKVAIYSDPENITATWQGADVCSYTGVFCAPALDDANINVVAGIDLNHYDIAGYLPPELGLLTDLALFHINSNRFCGIIPTSFIKLILMFEFDISNNRFVGEFPEVVLEWPEAKYLDLRFNDFEGELPPKLFTLEFDAIFLNNNRFTSTIPDTIGNSTVSVVSFAYNEFHGCIPSTVGNMPNVNEMLFIGNNMSGCFPLELGNIANLTVLDVSNNGFVGKLPESLSETTKLEILDVSNNELTGSVPVGICKLPKLDNFTFSYNYFDSADPTCMEDKNVNKIFDYDQNCLPNQPDQRDAEKCASVVKKTVDCGSCGSGSPPTQDDSFDQSPSPRTRAPPPEQTIEAGAPPPEQTIEAGAPPPEQTIEA